MKRLLIIILTVLVLAVIGLYVFDQYWIHHYDSLIAREAVRYQVDPDLVWSNVLLRIPRRCCAIRSATFRSAAGISKNPARNTAIRPDVKRGCWRLITPALAGRRIG